jgi:competence protein ComEC
MITAYYGFVLLQRKPDLLHAMAIAGFLILIIDSQQLFDVGFQLSFIAVFGIFWLNEPILKYLPKPKNTFQNFMVNVVSVSFSAQIVTFPLVVFTFINILFYPLSLILLSFRFQN